MPIAAELAAYNRSWLGGDLTAAITVWAIAVPESMAYAAIAGVPAEYGLYAAAIPLLGYAIFGSSRRITVGPSAAVAALSFATVAPFVAEGSPDFVVLTALLALVVGVILVIAGLARLGALADFLSEPVLKGFIVGVALTISLGQLGKLFRLEAEGRGFFTELADLVSKLGDLHLETALLGLACLAALFILERYLPLIPSALLVVIGSIAAVKMLHLTDVGVLVAGAIPSGLPSLSVPSVDWSVVTALIPGAIGVAIVVYGESMALSKTFSARHGERVDADQELIALGASNVAGGLFGAYVVNASNSRTAAADAAGQETQVSSFVVVVLVGVTLVFLTSFFEDLPEAALGAIVIHAVARLIRLAPITALRRRNRLDFWAAVATLAGVLVFDVLAGLMIGVLVSLAGLMRRAVRPRIVWLGLDPVTGAFHDRERDSVEEVDGVSIVRPGGELFFANIGAFRDAVVTEIQSRRPEAVILDAEAVTDIDTTATDELVKLSNQLSDEGVRLVAARMSEPVRHALLAAGLDLAGADYPRIHDAVRGLSDT